MIKDVFLLKNQGQIALFAPLKGLILELKESEINKVRQLIDQPQFSFNDLTDLFPEVDNNRLFQEESKEQKPEEECGFYPTSVILFPTLDCGLRCIYCYSDAGKQKINMDWQIAEATIDFIVNNAKSQKCKESSLEFHGGGEPTWNWTIFQKTIDYFQQKTRQNGLMPKINLATNGMLSKKQIEWISNRINSLQVSFDGMEEIQNFQRPTLKGGRSFAVVYNTIKSFLERKIQITIHCVITEKGINRIPQIVQFLIDNFPETIIHLEPVWECGRGIQTGQKFPSTKLFINGFIEAEKIAKSYKREIFYSGAGSNLIEFHQNFCGVSSPNFVVTPIGLVTACHEVSEKTHPFAKYFIYGHFDRLVRKFIFDYKKIKNLRNYSFEIDVVCKQCFARYYCAGDCLIKRLKDNGKRNLPFLNPRCKINQEIIKCRIFGSLITEEKDCYGKTSN